MMADYLSSLSPGLQIALGFVLLVVVYSGIEVVLNACERRALRDLQSRVDAEVGEETGGGQ
jgi:hypothetical protein